MDNRRGFDRKLLEFPVIIDTDVRGKTKNISSAGMLCEVDKKLPVFYDIHIMLQLPQEKLEIKGTTLRCLPVTGNRFDVALYIDVSQMTEPCRKQYALLVDEDI